MRPVSKRTGLAFPLDWAPEINWVNAVNVTARSTCRKSSRTRRGNFGLEVKVVEPDGGKRIATKVSVNDITNSAVHFEGTSKGESADLNNFLSFELSAGGTYQISAELDGQSAVQILIPGTNTQQLVVLSVNEFKPLKPRDEAKLKRALAEFFVAPAEKQVRWKFSRRPGKTAA